MCFSTYADGLGAHGAVEVRRTRNAQVWGSTPQGGSSMPENRERQLRLMSDELPERHTIQADTAVEAKFRCKAMANCRSQVGLIVRLRLVTTLLWSPMRR